MISRKFLFVAFWNFTLIFALISQVVLFKNSSSVNVPLYELTLISGILTGIYFGVNILSKTLAPVTNFLPESEIQELVEDVQKSENTSSPSYMSKKFLLTAFWCIYMFSLVAIPIFVNGIKLPIMEATVIAAALTGAYFGSNILDKVVINKQTAPISSVPPATPPSNDNPAQATP